MRWRIGSGAVLLALAASAATAGDAATPTVDTATWLTYNGPYSGERYSPLSQIDESNAGQLQEVCRVRVGELGAFETGLVVADGRMYVNTSNATLALDPSNCEVLWKIVDTSGNPGETNRGAGYADGVVFRGTPGARLSALNAATGQVLWSTPVGDAGAGEWIAAAPIAWHGLVLVGLAAGDLGIRGRYMAFDAKTGAVVWTFNLIPQSGEPGAESWSGVSGLHGGGGTWTTSTLDPASGELFIPVGNPSPDFNATTRQGANLYTNSVVVLDAGTGKLKWYYQVRAHDTHDLDLAAAPMLYEHDGKRLVVAAAKDGIVYGIDRRTHKLAFKTPLLPKYDNESLAPTPEGIISCPGPQSGVHWNGPALDRLNRAIVVGAVNQCGKLKSNEKSYQRGQIYFGGSYELLGKPDGLVSSLDAATGKLRWQRKFDSPVIAAVTPTAGGVTFFGELSGDFHVIRSSTGEDLKTLYTGGALAGGIITYSVGTTQFIAAATGNVSKVSVGGSGVPTIVIYSLSRSQTATRPVTIAAPVGTIALDAMIGEGLYVRVCAGCHGKQGEGNTGPALQGIAKRATLEQAQEWIRNPKSTAMPKLFPDVITDQDVESLAVYIRTLQ